MKKKLGLFILATTLLCIGCGGETPSQLTPTPDNFMPTMEEPREPSKNPSLDPSQPTPTPDNFMPTTEEPREPSKNPSLDMSVSTTEGEPIWAKGVQSRTKLFQHLNLDGIGDADDEAYVSIYQFGDYGDSITVLRIHLGSGETMSKIFPVYGYYSFQTGKLFSENKDAIILDIQDPTSNYNAATVFAVDVFPVGGDPFPVSIVRLDTTNSTIRLIHSGTQVIDIEGSSLQGLEIPSWNPSDPKNGEPIKNIFYWNPTTREWLQDTK